MKKSIENIKDDIIYNCILLFYLKRDTKEDILSNLKMFSSSYHVRLKIVPKIERNKALLDFISSGKTINERINNLYSVL